MKTPESVFKDLKEVEEDIFKRGPDGHIFKEAPSKESYEAFRLRQMEEQKKKFDVDKLGRQKGGVPSGFWFRGQAAGQPGMKHNVAAHNMFINPHPDAYFLNESDANVFKQNMAWDRDLFKSRMKYNIPEVEDVQEQISKSIWSMIPLFVLVG